MKILTLHCDYIKFKPIKKAISISQELSEEERKGKQIKEALVVLSAVERGDEKNPLKIIEATVENIEDIAKQVKAKKIVIYPYAHLSPELASPDTAIEILKGIQESLQKRNYSVDRAPFGYYKEFELKCKGHPLAELSRHIFLDEQKKGEFDGKEIKEKIVEEKYDYKQLLRQISKAKLDTRELKENDHRILGQKLDLFSFNDVAPGMVFWHNKGLIIYNELINFWREEHRKAGYIEIKTPQVMDSKLWKISGHWDKYKENNLITSYEGRPFLIKPMNCPGGMLVYKSSPKSYKDFPLRIGEIGTVHRCELSGVLSGLFRLIQFTQDDAHIFCLDEKQVKSEIVGIIKMIENFYKTFKIEFDHVELSTRPEKRIGSEEDWDKAEKILEEVLKENKIKYKLNKGEGAFYGPKIDFHIKDSLGRTWQCSTIQLDFLMPERFELEYTDKNNKKKRPIMLHRVIYGSIERFIGILLEHTNGNLPLWISPVQAKVLSLTDRNIITAEKIFEILKEAGIRVEKDFEATTVNEKIRNAELMKIPYIILIGDKEEQNNTIAVRRKGQKPEFDVKIDKLIEELKLKIKNRD